MSRRNGSTDRCPIEREGEPWSPVVVELFTDAWSHHASTIFARCRFWMGGNQAEAEEAFSRAALRSFDRFSRARGRIEKPRAWFLRVAYTVCMDLYRERRRRHEVGLDPELIDDSGAERVHFLPATENPERCALYGELHRFLSCSVAELPERLRETMIVHLRSNSYREVASHLGITEVNARKRIQESRKILRRRLIAYRSGKAIRAVSPTRCTLEALPVGESTSAIRWRIEALRHGLQRTTDGIESVALLLFDYRPEPLSPRRRLALERYVADHPGGWKKHLELGRSLLASGSPAAALPYLEHVVDRQPCRLEGWLELATAYRLLARREDTLDVYARALMALTTPRDLHYVLGCKKRLEGKLEPAARAFEASASAAPQATVPRVALARLQLSMGRPFEALAAFDTALRADPDDVAALTLSFEPLHLFGRSREAMTRVRRALELDPENPLARIHWTENRPKG